MQDQNLNIEKGFDPFGNRGFEQLFEELYEPLCIQAMRFVHDRQVAEDLVQDQFVYVWQHRNRLRDTTLHAYMYTSVRNRSISYLKKHFVRSKISLPEEDNNPNLSDYTQLPSEILENNELAELLEKAMASLPERCRTIFVMKKFGEMSHKDIAAKLQISVKTIEAQITIAYKKLSSFMQKYWPILLILISKI